MDRCTDKDVIQKIVQRIKRCPFLLSLKWHFSSSLNGVHIVLWCNRRCDDCRLVFDDPVRYSADRGTRLVFERDVLFTEKKRMRLSDIFK